MDFLFSCEYYNIIVRKYLQYIKNKLKIICINQINQIEKMNFKVHLSLIHRAFTDRTISEHTFLLKYIPETENRRSDHTDGLEGKDVS